MKLEPRGDTEEGHGIAGRWRRVQGFLSGSLERLARNVYRPALERALEWRYATLAAGISVLLIALSVVATGRMKFNFFPEVESDYVSARLSMPQGTPVAMTAEGVRQLEQAARRVSRTLEAEYGVPVVKHVLAAVGEHASGSDERPSLSGESGGASHLGEVSLELLGGDVRPLSAKAVADLWREETPPIPGAEELVFNSALFSAGEPVNVQLQSANVADLQRAADELKARLLEYPGVFDVSDSFREGKQEIKLSILPSAEALGLTLDDLSRQVRQAFYGAEAQRIQRGRDDVRVMVRYPESQRRSLADLDDPAHPDTRWRRGALLRRGACRARPWLRDHQAGRSPARDQRDRRRRPDEGHVQRGAPQPAGRLPAAAPGQPSGPLLRPRRASSASSRRR